jgi:hypothetical protein
MLLNTTLCISGALTVAKRGNIGLNIVPLNAFGPPPPPSPLTALLNILCRFLWTFIYINMNTLVRKTGPKEIPLSSKCIIIEAKGTSSNDSGRAPQALLDGSTLFCAFLFHLFFWSNLERQVFEEKQTKTILFLQINTIFEYLDSIQIMNSEAILYIITLTCCIVKCTGQMDAHDIMNQMFASPPPTTSFSSGLRGSSSSKKIDTSPVQTSPASLMINPMSTERFVQQSMETKETAKTKAIGPCSCEFLSGVDATNPVGSTADCAPKSALCMFCMGAAYHDYWDSTVEFCEPFIGKAKSLCETVAGAVKGGAKKELETMYKAFGPQFGASAVYCREGGCCAGKPEGIGP